MNLKKFFVTATTVFLCANANAQMRVVDDFDGAAVTYANVYDDHGVFLGTTDMDGILPQQAEKKTRIAISHINYHSAEVATDTLRNGIIAMRAALHSLDSITVSASAKDYIVLSAYIRQYHIGDSTPASFKEGNYDYYFPCNGGRTKRHAKQVREVFRPSLIDDHAALTLFQNGPPKIRRKSNLLKMKENYSGADSSGVVVLSSDARFGKNKIRYDKKRQTCELYVDSMFNEKPFTFNLLGIHFQITSYNFGETYDISHGEPDLKSLLRSYDKLHVRLWLDGRKGPVTPVEEISEVYITSVSYASKASMKKAMRQNAESTVVVPPDIPALPKPLTDAFAAMVPAK